MASVPVVHVPRRGAPYWVRGFGVMLRWQLAGLRLWATVTISVEILSGVGMVYGMGLLVPDIPERAALYVTTGSAVVTTIVVGLILGPQLVAQQKAEHTYDYLLSMPVRRSATALSWYVVVVLVGFPGAVAALVAGSVRFEVPLHVTAVVVPAWLLAIFTATMLGYAVAHAISIPMVTIILSQVFVFLAFGYAPINFPADQMPHWLAETNRFLPFLPMATVVRDGLTRGLATHVAFSYCVLSAWAAGACAVAGFALGRRR